MNSSATHRVNWSLALLELLAEMAASNTNAVLSLLDGVNDVEKLCHYPEKGLVFAQGHWRAYYHCHNETPMHENEHGHFHLFTKTGDKDWSHVAGLSIDDEGQALQWFTVNRWVTGGPWLETGQFVEQIHYITARDMQECLVARWLGNLVQLYRDDLHDLLAVRENRLMALSKNQNLEKVLEHRQFYTLSTRAIDLTRTLAQNLSAGHTNSEQTGNGQKTECNLM